MEIVKIKISDITPYEGNAKMHEDDQIKKIADSIRQFSFNDPLGIWGEENLIVEGHGRLLALQSMTQEERIEALGGDGDEVDCIRLDHLDDEGRRAYALAHNQLTMIAEWNLAILTEELNKITSFDMDDFGFDVNMTTEEDPEAIDDDFDTTPPEVPQSKLGDIYRLGNHYLMCGDSTLEADMNALMGAGGDNVLADMVFTDPPWNVAYGASENPRWKKHDDILNDDMSSDDFKAFLDASFEQMAKHTKDGGMVYCVMSAQEWGRLMLAMEEAFFHWSSTIIWNKDQLVLSRKDYHTKYEPIYYGWKEGAPRRKPLEDRKQCDVWDIPRPKNSEQHPTMKPIPLMAQALKNSSDKGDIVLDQFGGSGSTLIACEQMNRVCYMMELSEGYCDVICARFTELTGKPVFKIAEGKSAHHTHNSMIIKKEKKK